MADALGAVDGDAMDKQMPLAVVGDLHLVDAKKERARASVPDGMTGAWVSAKNSAMPASISAGFSRPSITIAARAASPRR